MNEAASDARPQTTARHVAVVPAAGVGSRLGADRPKQYLALGGKTVLECTVLALLSDPRFDLVIVVVSPEDRMAQGLAGLRHARVRIAPVGGASRRDSVLGGLTWLATHTETGSHDWVWVHDAARPGIERSSLDRLHASVCAVPTAGTGAMGALLAVPVADTLRREEPGSGGLAARTESREGLWQAQTPQVFRLGELTAALERHANVTDEAAAMQAEGARIQLVPGSRRNFKVTTMDDLQAMRQALQGRFRIGQGWDVHALVPGRPLILGGVTIPFDRGLLGHSDADALLHAITDALFGAAGLGDIGRHFPDTDPRFAGADSRELLREACRRVNQSGWTISNLDATIVAQSPKLAPHIPAMQNNLSADLGLAPDAVNIKAKTSERLGFAGRGEGIEVHAVVMLTGS